MAKSKLNIWYMIVAFVSCIPVVFYKNSILYKRIGYINILTLLVLAVTVVNIILNYRSLFRNKYYISVLGIGGLLFLSDIVNECVNLSYMYRFARTYTEWQPVYLIGAANSFIFYYLTAALFSIIYSITLKGKITSGCIVFILMELISLLIGGSMAGFCSMCLFLLCICFRVSKRFSTFVSRHMKAIVGVILLLLIVIIIRQSPYITKMIIAVSGEEHSFSEKMYIWAQAVRKICEKPFFGYGTLNESIVHDFKGYLRTAHNTFLEIAILGGGLSLLVYVGSSIISIIRYSRFYRDTEQSELRQAIYTIIIAFLCFVIIFMVEQNVYFPILFSLIAFTGNLRYISSK